MIKKVVIIGGGVAGLTAAHELVERGFEVVVYERNREGGAGGKARSVDTDAEAGWYTNPTGRSTDDPPRRRYKGGLPGEHGFRFFPGWYRHLPDTMARIPYKSDGRTVLDNLVSAEVALFASYDREPVRAQIRFPANWQELRRIAAFPKEILRLGLTTEELTFFLGKMWTFLTSSEKRRQTEFEPRSWWDFMEGDRQSKAFRDYLIVGATRTLVAAKPREASAYTIGKMVLQTMFDVARPATAIDRLLNGPTNEVWIDPWVDYLKAQGVKFHFEYELQSIQLGNSGAIARVELFRVPYLVRCLQERLDAAMSMRELSRRFAALPDALQRDPGVVESPGWADHWSRNLDAGQIIREAQREMPSLPGGLDAERLRDAGLGQELQVLRELAQAFLDLDRHCARWLAQPETEPIDDRTRVAFLIEHLQPPLIRLREQLEVEVSERNHALSLALDDRARVEATQSTNAGEQSEPAAFVEEQADFYIFALPVEQMAYYVHRSESLQRHDPSLINLARLAEHVDWMAGIQFYLDEEIGLTRGHIDFLDSEWHLTGLAQSQFWSREHDLEDYGNGSVRTIISVDISSWDVPGRLYRKPAWDCTPDEIAREVWEQMKSSLNRPGAPPVITDEMLCTEEGRWYYLDQSIGDHFDRRKQGFYEKFRSVGFSADELLRKTDSAGRAGDVPQAHGARLLRNAEPLLVNRPRSWRLRPESSTAIRNMFLAADYVRTNTNLATMEGANEAARRAVNDILAQCRASFRPCKIWDLWEPMGALRAVDEHLFEKRIRFQDTGADIPVRLAAGAAKTAVNLAGRALGFLARSTNRGGDRPQGDS